MTPITKKVAVSAALPVAVIAHGAAVDVLLDLGVEHLVKTESSATTLAISAGERLAISSIWTESE